MSIFNKDTDPVNLNFKKYMQMLTDIVTNNDAKSETMHCTIKLVLLLRHYSTAWRCGYSSFSTHVGQC